MTERQEIGFMKVILDDYHGEKYESEYIADVLKHTKCFHFIAAKRMIEGKSLAVEEELFNDVKKLLERDDKP